MDEFTRDPKLESLAFQAGWSLEKIKRTRLSDLRKLVAKAQETCVEQLSPIISTPLEKKQDIPDISSPSGSEILDITNTFQMRKIKKQPKKTHVQPQITEKYEYDEDTYILQLHEISVERKKLEEKLVALNAREKETKKRMRTNAIKANDIPEFQLDRVCQLPDAPIRISTYFESICKAFDIEFDKVQKKRQLVKADEFDDEEKELINQSLQRDSLAMEALKTKLRSLYNELTKVILRKKGVLDMIESSSYDENDPLMLKMRGKNCKLEIVATVIHQKLTSW